MSRLVSLSVLWIYLSVLLPSLWTEKISEEAKWWSQTTNLKIHYISYYYLIVFSYHFLPWLLCLRGLPHWNHIRLTHCYSVLICGTDTNIVSWQALLQLIYSLYILLFLYSISYLSCVYRPRFEKKLRSHRLKREEYVRLLSATSVLMTSRGS